ncbi:MAG: tRNA (adenosine(37)-N6)-threonylcarbamoyltransferase complex dimerization subunit type 1 TsaB [Magnetococcales bacterium]|nr:tRNA (adenosine(37)-N6)-threonylcarbamoyltransferase complex dimerization subunit type 1 TsaB [Magnetococcales bacterium]
MKILAMDSCFPRGGVGLLEAGRVVGKVGFEGPEGHVALLPRALEAEMGRVGWRMGDLERIAVTLGPGSFSGARIALGVAKGMAAALRVPVAGFSTLEVVAAGANCSGWVAAMLDARRGEVYAALYEIQEQTAPRLRSELLVCDPETLSARLRAWNQGCGGALHLTGNALELHGETWQPLEAEGISMLPRASWPLDVGRLAEMGASLPSEALGMVESLEPVYVRKADAKEPTR